MHVIKQVREWVIYIVEYSGATAYYACPSNGHGKGIEFSTLEEAEAYCTANG